MRRNAVMNISGDIALSYRPKYKVVNEAIRAVGLDVSDPADSSWTVFHPLGVCYVQEA